jgi:hypothetical protein
VKQRSQTRTTPPNDDEDAVWRAIAGALLVVPKTLDAGPLAGFALNLWEYTVLVHLLEAASSEYAEHVRMPW